MNITALQKNQEGVVAILALMAVSIFGLIVITTLNALALTGYQNISSASETEQTFRAAEAGIEEGLYRIYADPTIDDAFNLSIDGHDVVVVVKPDGYGGTITSQAVDPSGKTRTLEVQYTRVNFGGGLDSAIQTGGGGLLMANNSEVIGNVFTNGNILPDGGGGNCSRTITGDVTVANASVIDSVYVKASTTEPTVGGTARAHSILNKSCVDRDAFYWDDSTIGASVEVNGSDCFPAGSNPHCHPGSPDTAPLPLPFQNEIVDWKNAIDLSNPLPLSDPCPAGFDYCITTSKSLGNQQIIGNVYIAKFVTLTLTGNLWITGDVVFEASGSATKDSLIQVDPSLGPWTTVIISDGTIDIENNYDVQGSGDPNSFVLLISTSTNMGSVPAIYASNGSNSLIFAAPYGEISVKNGGMLNAAAAEKIHLEETSQVIYNPRLASFAVSSGKEESIGIAEDTWEEVCRVIVGGIVTAC